MTERLIVELDRGTLGPDVTVRAPRFAHRWRSYRATEPREVVARAQGADIVVTNKVALPADVLARLPELRLIAVAATGVDVIDRQAARDRGVAIVNIRDYANDSVPEHTLALMLALIRQLPAYRDAVAAGKWQASGQFCFFEQPIHTLAGKTLGLVGFGSIAQRVAALARAFGMRVVVTTPRPIGAEHKVTRVDLDKLLAEADVVSLHCPLTEATRHLIDARALARMRPGALLINTARGALVDESALAAALVAGRLGGAGLDVLSTEPPADDNPLLALAGEPNVIVTPHVAWAAEEAMQRLADQLIELIEAWHDGSPRHLVTT